MNEVEHVLAVQNELGEGPIWHVGEQTLYWVDIDAGRFHKYSPASGRHETVEVGTPLGALAFRAAGGFVVAVQEGIGFWQEGRLEIVHRPEADRPGARFNDGAVDRQGRFWAGTLADDEASALYRFDPDGSLHKMETGITVSNGIGWSPDNRTMYYTDSRRHVIYAYDFDAATGAIANRRNWVQTPDTETPDGLTVDTEGFIWSAKWGGWKVTRYDPAGRIEREIRLPTEFITSCTFGGPNLDELYVTSAWMRIPPAERHKQPQAGDLFRIRAGVRGFEEPFFAG